MKKINKFVILCIVILTLAFIVFFIATRNSPTDNYFESIGRIEGAYELSVTEFQEFLNNQSLDRFEDKKTDKNIYLHPSDEEAFIQDGSNLIYLDERILDILKDNHSVKEMLNGNGIYEEIIKVNIITSRDVPITVQVKTESSNYYITWEKHKTETFDIEYLCNFYTADTYIDKFAVKKGYLVINDITIAEDVEMYYEYAVVPLMDVLTSLGADVEHIDEDNAKIYINDECFDLNFKEISLTNKDKYDGYNIFHLIAGGEYTVSYDSGNGIMIDTNVLSVVLNEMGVKCQIDYDRDMCLVTIKNISAENIIGSTDDASIDNLN